MDMTSVYAITNLQLLGDTLFQGVYMGDDAHQPISYR